MRTLLVSPYDTRPGHGIAAHMVKEVREKLSGPGAVTEVSVLETRWRKVADYEDQVEHLASQDAFRLTWRDRIVNRYIASSSKQMIFNFLGFDEGLAIDTIAVAYIAAFSWPNVSILADAPGSNGYFFLFRDLFAGKPNPPKIFHSAEDFLVQKFTGRNTEAA